MEGKKGRGEGQRGRGIRGSGRGREFSFLTAAVANRAVSIVRFFSDLKTPPSTPLILVLKFKITTVIGNFAINC
jgi:hypothetical protein